MFTRTRALPPVPEYKVTQIVRYEIQQQIPFSLDQIAFDYQVLQRTEAGGYDVLMAAIKVDVVEKRLDIIRDIKRRVDTVDVCPLAAYNWLKYTGEFGEQGDCVALIDLGAATTDIVIERENQFRFTRSLNLGGNDITSAIAAEFGASFAEAEKMKRERGFAPSGDAQRDGKGGEVIGRVLNRLVSEISRSFAYFRSQPGGGPVSRIIVTGGGACLRNIIPFLQRQLGIEVRIAQPLAGLAIAPGAQEVNEHPEQAAVVLGLALRCCERVTVGINLIPPRILEAARYREQAVYWGLSLITLALIAASIVPVMAQKNKLILDEIDLQKKVMAQYDPRMVLNQGPPSGWTSEYEKEIKAKNTEIQGYQTRVKAMDEGFAGRRAWLGDLVAINDARPVGKFLVFWSVESTLLEPALIQQGYGAASFGGGSEDDEDQGYQGRGGGLRGGGMSGSIAPPPLKYSSTGFRGISPMGATGGMGVGFGGGGRHGRSMDEDEDSYGVAGSGPGMNPEQQGPGDYNGVTVQGFAQDIPTIQQFVENHKKSGKYIDGGVFFDDRFTNPELPTVLDNAWSGAQSSSLGMTSGMGVGMGGRGGGMGGRGGLNFGAGMTGRGGGYGGGGRYSGAGGISASTLWNWNGSVYTFRVDLQYSGERADEAKPTTTQQFGRGPISMASRGGLARGQGQ